MRSFKKIWDRVVDGRFLFLSILVHFLFVTCATVWVVQKYYAKPRIEFKGGQKGASQSTRVMEYKVSLAKKNRVSLSPVQVQRVTTEGLSKVNIPEMPATSSMNEISPTNMGGATGGLPGLDSRAPIAGGGAGVGGGGVGFTMFGFHGKPAAGASALVGAFYDIKQTPSKKPSGVNDFRGYAHVLDEFLKSGWNEGLLRKYFKAKIQLYATQVFIPGSKSAKAPESFGVEKDVEASRWLVLYKGRVSPPTDGVYHFVGRADNILIVRLDGNIVLDRTWDYQQKFGIDKEWKPDEVYGTQLGSVAKGPGVQLSSSKGYDMEVLLGDDGGIMCFNLLFAKEGVQYKKGPQGIPLFPVFRVSSDKPPKPEVSHPWDLQYLENGPIWKMASPADSNSPFSHPMPVASSPRDL